MNTKTVQTVLEAVRSVDIAGRHCGLVPIPAVRLALKKMARKTLDNALLGMEKDYVIDLKTANDPRLIDDPAACILRPDGSHLEFIVIR